MDAIGVTENMITIIQQRLMKKIWTFFEKRSDLQEFYYFGYGANIDQNFFKKRITNVIYEGTGFLEDFQFSFNTPCEYKGQGYGGISPIKNSKVYGSVYKISESGLRLLDWAEWLPFHFYERRLEKIKLLDGSLISAWVYFPKYPRGNLLPSEGYKNLVLKGAVECNFPREYLDFLGSFSSLTSFEMDNSFNLRNPGRSRILPTKCYIHHDKLRERLSRKI